jgi:hypothetical protein
VPALVLLVWIARRDPAQWERPLPLPAATSL